MAIHLENYKALPRTDRLSGSTDGQGEGCIFEHFAKLAAFEITEFATARGACIARELFREVCEAGTSLQL